MPVIDVEGEEYGQAFASIMRSVRAIDQVALSAIAGRGALLARVREGADAL